MRFKTFLLSTLALSVLAAGAATAAPGPYAVTNLGTLGGKQSYAAGLNDSGIVVGHSSGPVKAGQTDANVLEFTARAFLFDGSTMGQLGPVGHLGLIVNKVKDANGNVTSTTTEVPNSFANAINRTGVVVGYGVVDADADETKISREDRPVVYMNGVLSTFGVPPNQDSIGAIAESINDNDLIVGRTITRAIKRNADGTPVTENGQPVKESFDRAFTYDLVTQQWTILPVIDTDPNRGAFGLAINNHGVVAGSAGKLIDNIGYTRAYRWNPGDASLSELGAFAGKMSYPHDINDSGKIVGESSTDQFDGTTGGQIRQAFLSVPGSAELINLGYLSAAKRSSIALGINDQDQIVGFAGVGTATSLSGFVDVNHAFLSQVENGTRVMYDLNSMLPCEVRKHWVLVEANDINRQGQIAGVGTFDGEVRAFLLNPPAGEFAGMVVDCPVAEAPGDSGGGGGSLANGLLALLAALGLARRSVLR